MSYDVTIKTIPERYAATVQMTLPRYEDEGMIWSVLVGETCRMKLTEADLKSRYINFGENEIDKWCLSNCCCAVDNVGNIQPVKIPGQASKRIDGALTFIMLFETYRRFKNDYMMLIGG